MNFLNLLNMDILRNLNLQINTNYRQNRENKKKIVIN